MPDSTMVHVLTQMHLAKARLQLYDGPPEAAPDSVLRRHHLDRSAFERALGYYSGHPQAYAAVYDSVVDRLNERRRPLPREQSAR